MTAEAKENKQRNWQCYAGALLTEQIFIIRNIIYYLYICYIYH